MLYPPPPLPLVGLGDGEEVLVVRRVPVPATANVLLENPVVDMEVDERSNVEEEAATSTEFWTWVVWTTACVPAAHTTGFEFPHAKVWLLLSQGAT